MDTPEVRVKRFTDKRLIRFYTMEGNVHYDKEEFTKYGFKDFKIKFKNVKANENSDIRFNEDGVVLFNDVKVPFRVNGELTLSGDYDLLVNTIVDKYQITRQKFRITGMMLGDYLTESYSVKEFIDRDEFERLLSDNDLTTDDLPNSVLYDGETVEIDKVEGTEYVMYTSGSFKDMDVKYTRCPDKNLQRDLFDGVIELESVCIHTPGDERENTFNICMNGYRGEEFRANEDLKFKNSICVKKYEDIHFEAKNSYMVYGDAFITLRHLNKVWTDNQGNEHRVFC